ncbi:S8 family peptidase [Actinomadura alba]|uniref:S8 family serine peptidase n=1 Tax=Actinomadura alba TaxID=406431 RepID=A0ABR7LXC7_9ACTN|nr:S8 family serine peptidase [Actinomadura alba]MBC6469507.1 S8 family serine peptidase [Actinomadura alba]
MLRWTSRVSARVAVGAVALALCVNASTAPGHAAPEPRGKGLSPAAPPGYDVTLITGDRVHVAGTAEGPKATTVTPAPREDGSTPSFQVTQNGEDLVVLPRDVASLVPERLDPELFNVTGLREQHYDDASSRTLPLIVTYANTVRGAPVPMPATSSPRRLESVNGAGVQADKKQAGKLGTALSRLARSTGRSRMSATDPLAGVEKIWLDRLVKANLEQSVPQVHAPEAWQAGYDGSGTTVAVLDTGVDTTHPDLAGKIAAERNFTTDADARDGLGHGTHVASILAGSGSASAGKRKGVAPGATLISGKVLENGGFGQTSWIIQGMEWAAGDKDADVVNMSLGGEAPGGPLSQAVDRLTERDGALFVIAAGNSGCAGCVKSPGDAASALTVGAVDHEDRLAEFSSRGPNSGDFAVKPEITAPGVDIAAARAEGTFLGDVIDGHYTRVPGTSMAAPHVAGAAALLLQARPGMRPGELKSALAGTAEPNDDNTLDEQGAGRLNVARALAGPVVASTGSVSFGHFAWPHTGRAPVGRTVTYRNLTTAPVTLALEVALRDTAGKQIPAKALKSAHSTITVPANGTASTELTLDTTAAPPGRYSGVLTARTTGGTALRTLVSTDVETERYNLRVTGIARDGRPARGEFNVLDVEDGGQGNSRRLLPGDPAKPCTDARYEDSSCIRVPAGTYSVLGVIETLPPSQESTGTGRLLHRSLVGDPELKITKDTDLVLDARRATEVKIETPGHETKANVGAVSHLMWHRAPEQGPAMSQGILIASGEQMEERLFLQPMPRVRTGKFAAYTRWRLDAPAITLRVAGRALETDYYDPFPFSDFAEEFPRLDGKARLPLADAGLGRPGDFAGRDLRGRLALIRRSDDLSVAEQSNNAAAVGARLVAIYNDGPGLNTDPGGVGVKLKIPTVRLSHEEGRGLLQRLARGSVTIDAKGIPSTPYRYDLVFTERQRIPDTLRYVARTRDLAQITNDFHSQLGESATMDSARYHVQPWEEFATAYTSPVTGPLSRTDYITTDTPWTGTATTPARPYNTMWPHPETHEISVTEPGYVTYEPGDRKRVTWFKQPLTPGLTPERPLARAGDQAEVSMQGFVDAGGNTGMAYTSFFEGGLATDFRMYQGEELIAQTDYVPVGVVDLSPDPATYRIDYAVNNNASWARLSTRTRTSWTFPSRRPREGRTDVLPLLVVGHDVKLDLLNRARPGSDGLTLTVRHQPGAPKTPVKSVSVEVSYDDGATWSDVKRLRTLGDGAYSVSLDRPPAKAGFVSLRINAEDLAGSRVAQEIIRAYELPRNR